MKYHRPKQIEGELTRCPACGMFWKFGKDLRYKGTMLSKEESVALTLSNVPLNSATVCSKCYPAWRKRKDEDDDWE